MSKARGLFNEQRRFYYSLDDDSHNAIQSMQIKLMYYNHASSIPVALRNQIESSRTNALGNNILSVGSAPVRPPLIIVTRLQ